MRHPEGAHLRLIRLRRTCPNCGTEDDGIADACPGCGLVGELLGAGRLFLAKDTDQRKPALSAPPEPSGAPAPQ
jgi:hypothetical protein